MSRCETVLVYLDRTLALYCKLTYPKICVGTELIGIKLCRFPNCKIFSHWLLLYFNSCIMSIFTVFSPFSTGMLPVFLLAGLILALSIPGTTSESATLRFLGQTDFVVNESNTAVIRLVVERVGDPVNVTALILVGHGATFFFISLYR